jgi:hypothetical protein
MNKEKQKALVKPLKVYADKWKHLYVLLVVRGIPENLT